MDTVLVVLLHLIMCMIDSFAGLAVFMWGVIAILPMESKKTVTKGILVACAGLAATIFFGALATHPPV